MVIIDEKMGTSIFMLYTMKLYFCILSVLLSITDASGAYYRCDRDRVPCGCGFSDVEAMARIINGEDTLPYSWSMMVTVRPYGGSFHECGGTIISDSHILTAARCVQNVPPDSVESVSIAGSIHFLAEKTSTIRRVDAIHIHPQWNDGINGYAHDLAILHLSNPLNFSQDPYISQACVPPRNPLVALTEHPRNGSRLIIIGWGSKQFSSFSDVTQTLQQATIQAIHHDDPSCADSIYDPQLQFCAGLHAGGKGPCSGDAGGPIMEWDHDHWNQVGIVSYTPVDCATAGYQAIYTRLAAYHNWIQSILKSTNHTLSYVANNPSTTTEYSVTETPKPYQCNQSSVQCGCGLNPVKLNLGRIVGGHEAMPYSWSMMVSLQIRNYSEHICGGSILNDRFILTAAHCVNISFAWLDGPVEFSVVVGIHDRFEENQIVRHVDRIIIHPDWNSERDYRHDIAILHLSEPLDLTNNGRIYPACMPHLNATEEIVNYPSNGSSLLVIGWGTLKSGDQEYPSKLQQVEVFSIDNNDPICRNSLDDYRLQFCAGLHQGTKDSCQGDSGGPIFQWKGNYWQQVGITSYGQGCAEPNSPGIYTRLAFYTTWIESVINDSLTMPVPNPTTLKPPRKYLCNKNASCGCGVNDVTISLSRIVGGEDAVPYSWSMLVSIRLGSPGEHACGGTILTERFILTAAHCVGRLEPEAQYNIFVVAGIHNQLENSPIPIIRRVRRFFIHPDWNKNVSAGPNDIALLELVRPIDIGLSFRTTRTCLPQLNQSIDISQYPSNNTRLMVMGWGALEFGSFFSITKILQQAQIFLIDSSDSSCNATIKDPRSQLCAGLPQGSKGTCQGDSGGPIFQWMNDHWEQVGLTSYARGCAREGHPTVFTRIAYFQNWIRSIIEPPFQSTTLEPVTETVYQCDQQALRCGCSMDNVIIFSRMHDSHEVIPFSWSMVVSLQSTNGSHLCSGTILSDWHILIAAHCLSTIDDYRHIRIHSGIHLLSQNDAIKHTIARVFIHPFYSDSSPFLHDLALLELQSSLDVNQHPRISLSCLPTNTTSPDSKINNNATLVAVGWNRPWINGNRLQQVLLKSVNIIDHTCPILLDNEEYQFCAQLPWSDANICLDDVGSPVFSYENHHWVQVGMVANRKGCEGRESAETFTRLKSYIDWIREMMKNTSKPTMTSSTPLSTLVPAIIETTTDDAVVIQSLPNLLLIIIIAILFSAKNSF